MDLLPDRPEILHRHRDIGGVLDIVQFHTDDFSLPTLLAAIAMAIPQPLQRPAGVDIDRLQTLGSRPISEPAFFGDWCDPSSRALIRRGTVTLDDGTTLTDPPLASLGARTIVSGSAPVPQPGSGGQFAYAFSHPPYPLDAPPATIQALFDATIELLLPPWSPTQILDWSHPELPSVSSYFAEGMEWWGVFLFTLASPGIERLTVIGASATD